MSFIAIIQNHARNNENIAVRELMFARVLQELGYKVYIYAMTVKANVPKSIKEKNGVRIAFYHVDNPNATSAEHTSVLLAQDLVSDRPDIVLFKGLGYRIISDLSPSISSFAKIGLIIGGKVLHKTLDIFDIVFVEHPLQSELIRSTFPGVKAHFLTMPKLIDWSEVPQSETKKEYDICNVGQFIPRKNQIALAELMGCVSMVLIGDGPEIDRVKSCALNHPNVLFTGQLPRSQVYSFIARSRLMVHTSIHEGLPRVSAEGFACGTPLLAFYKTLKNVYKDSSFVRLIDENNLKQEVLDLLADKPRLNRMSVEASNYAQKQYSSGALMEIAKEFSFYVQHNLTV